MDELIPVKSDIFTVPYETNMFDYRIDASEDFNDAIWFFGCSHVYGYGLPRHKAAPKVLEKLTKIPVINLGVIKSGPDLILGNLTRLLKKYKPKAVVTAYPSMTRKMFSSDKGTVFFTNMHLSDAIINSRFKQETITFNREFIEYVDLIKQDKVSEENVKNIETIRKLLQDHSIPHVEFSYLPDSINGLPKDIYILGTRESWPDVASDNIHPGPVTQAFIAGWVKNQLRLKKVLNDK